MIDTIPLSFSIQVTRSTRKFQSRVFSQYFVIVQNNEEVASACNFTKSNSPPCMFFRSFKLYKWFQIGQIGLIFPSNRNGDEQEVIQLSIKCPKRALSLKKRPPKISTILYSNSFIKVLHQNITFHKSGQVPKAGNCFCLEQGLTNVLSFLLVY